jgi:hypothetical protein
MRLDLGYDDRGARNLLKGIVSRVEDDAALDMLGQHLVDHEERAFATEGFGQWAPLSPATLKAKNSGRILVDTGRLEQVLTSRASIRVEGDDVSLDEDPVARFLRTGARGMPRRNPTPAPDQSDVRDWAQDALRYMTEGTR